MKVLFKEGLDMMKFEEIIRNNKVTMGEAIAEFAKITDAEGGELEGLISETMEDILFDFFSANTKEKCWFTDWTKVPNQVVFSKGFWSIFEDDMLAYFIAYWSIQMIFDCSGSGITGYLQPFMFKGIDYWVIREENCVMVYFQRNIRKDR